MVSKPITVRQLETYCKYQRLQGNGDKVIMISSDDEGNAYHYLWYEFTPMEKMEEPIEFNGKTIECPFEFADERVAKKEDTIILG